MVSTVNPYGVNSSFRAQGNAAGDFLSLELIIKTCRSLEIKINEFWSEYDPKKFYRHIQSVNKATIGTNLNKYA